MSLSAYVPAVLFQAEFDRAEPQPEKHSPLLDFIIHIIHASVLHLGLSGLSNCPNNIASGAFKALKWPRQKRVVVNL